MRKGVIADDMAGFVDFANDVGTLPHVASDKKKSCRHVVLRQEFEQSQCVRIIRAVIVGKGELLRAGGETGKCASVPLSGGSHRLVASGDSAGGRGGSNKQGGEHGGDSNRLSHRAIGSLNHLAIESLRRAGFNDPGANCFPFVNGSMTK